MYRLLILKIYTVKNFIWMAIINNNDLFDQTC